MLHCKDTLHIALPIQMMDKLLFALLEGYLSFVLQPDSSLMSELALRKVKRRHQRTVRFISVAVLTQAGCVLDVPKAAG